MRVNVFFSATPYNKAYLDLSNQLRLFLEPDDVVGIRPEEYLRRECEGRPEEFTRRHQCALNGLAAFEKSDYPDDWRELMRLFMVRRTRSFVERNYAFIECPVCQTILKATQDICPKCSRKKDKVDKKFLVLEGGSRFHFPKRIPKALHFQVREKDPDDQYAKLYSKEVVNTIRQLYLPRYGLGNYLKLNLDFPPTNVEAAVIDNLSRAGKRLIGFCRTNLFKRLESSGHAFILSLRRHILRNYIYLHALENGLPLPVGTQDSSLFDTRKDDQDSDSNLFGDDDFENENELGLKAATVSDFKKSAAEGYLQLQNEYFKKFEWVKADFFVKDLIEHLQKDAESLIEILSMTGEWHVERDEKFKVLYELITKKHPNEKILIFSQFADTIDYLDKELKNKKLKNYACVTGSTKDPYSFSKKFSPISNGTKDKILAEDELRVLIATDVLSEGQNLQDAAIIVNFDLPWAIIRLIQRAGRVDRIGQKAEEIYCYSFIPAEGVERVINLRARVRQRLLENAEVVGTDENFFEDEKHDSLLHDLFTEKSGILDDLEDDEVDLSSLAYQIWKNASDADPTLRKIIPDMSNVVFSTKSISTITKRPGDIIDDRSKSGVMVYVRTSDGNDALAWIDEDGNTVTESQHEILRAASCEPKTNATKRLQTHHSLVQKAAINIQSEQQFSGGQLGKPSSARRRAYEHLKDYASEIKGSLFDIKALHQAIDAIYENPLTELARDQINREIKTGITNEKLAELVLSLHEEDRLCVPKDNVEAREPSIICSLGISKD